MKTLLAKISDKGEIDYSGNNLCYPPRTLLLTEFPQIKMLNISKNSLTEINETMIKSLPNLQSLDASFNKIVFVTSQISLWESSLLKLKLGNNFLTEIPNEITKLSKLRYLKLNDNKIEYLPSDF